jgi:uncharacterized membrane protein YgcG
LTQPRDTEAGLAGLLSPGPVLDGIWILGSMPIHSSQAPESSLARSARASTRPGTRFELRITGTATVGAAITIISDTAIIVYGLVRIHHRFGPVYTPLYTARGYAYGPFGHSYIVRVGADCFSRGGSFHGVGSSGFRSAGGSFNGGGGGFHGGGGGGHGR